MLNGPCGGVRDGLCEVDDFECVWVSIYKKLKEDGKEKELLKVRMPEVVE